MDKHTCATCFNVAEWKTECCWKPYCGVKCLKIGLETHDLECVEGKIRRARRMQKSGLKKKRGSPRRGSPRKGSPRRGSPRRGSPRREESPQIIVPQRTTPQVVIPPRQPQPVVYSSGPDEDGMTFTQYGSDTTRKTGGVRTTTVYE